MQITSCATQNMQDCSKHWIWTMGSLSSFGCWAGITREAARWQLGYSGTGTYCAYRSSNFPWAWVLAVSTSLSFPCLEISQIILTLFSLRVYYSLIDSRFTGITVFRTLMKVPGKLWHFFLNPSLEQKGVWKVDLSSVANFFILSHWGFGWKRRQKGKGRKKGREGGRENRKNGVCHNQYHLIK